MESEWIGVAHTVNIKVASSFIMLVSTSVYSVITNNGVLQYHRYHSLPTHSAISSSAERQSTNKTPHSTH